jgi:P-type Cu+ transporter
VLALPVVLLAMTPRPHEPWLSLVLATPVAAWGAWPFHRAALANAGHGAATMDTLVSLGVTAAYAWSLAALITGTGATYLDVAAGSRC